MDTLRIMDVTGTSDTAHHRNIMRPLLCHEHTEWQRFDDLYQDYWHAASRVKKSQDTASGSISRKSRAHAGTLTGLAGVSEELGHLQNASGATGAGAGRQRTLAKADFRFLTDARAARHIEHEAERLAMVLRRKLQRRREISRGGTRMDMRHTLRNNLKYGGLPVHPLYTQQKREEPHLIVLHDVSHSMTWNNPLLFRFVRGLIRTFEKSAAYVFHTRLFCVTDLYRERSLEVMRQRLEARNHLWLGGTCIAASLREFMTIHGKKNLRRESIVIIISDGFDSDAPEQLAQSVQQLKSCVKHILWLNPMLGRAGFEVDAEFATQVRPHIDLLAPAHSLESLQYAVSHIARGLAGQDQFLWKPCRPGLSNPAKLFL